ncbi:hypothetical protein H6784_00320 [Candidatus Nomurabacteria bacterium]|nr:hypothetical protein [Candidatus Kaiserbacteria bacterium]MCB9813837.1 hypothetical protein [Candidatus Nomurabacteria bacterium]
MKKADFLSVLITFVVGALAGAYLYTTQFAPTATISALPTKEKLSEFSITSEVYGGCRDACPTFHVENDGSYRYFYNPIQGEAPVSRKGSLPAKLQKELRNTLTPDLLKVQSKTKQPVVCNSYTDGIDVSYVVVVDGQEFKLNSCGTAVDAEGKLWKTLGSVWDYFETSGSTEG